ncbi:M56 family metallopeptidase [Paenibacillus guangzhouensis]|uniref:M56 family metallopeptidase n=1 Tax=Paenibacillus guangzhouensis TaxID=1473112 RepID=UPI001266F459|nr:M56 family metallopeptidase [Paenibacillus guangzhouensis]
MNSPVKLRWVCALMVVFIVLLSAQAVIYLADAMRGDATQGPMIHAGIVAMIVGYTLVRMIWRIVAQSYGSWTWRKHFRSIQHVKLTRRFAYKYRSLGTEILVVKDRAFIALTIGMRRPTIVLSSSVFDLFNDDEVKAIILHEWHHCRNRDNVKLFLMKLLTEGFGYLPIMRPIFHYYHTWMELLADRFAMQRMGTEVPLAHVLLKLSKLGAVRQHAAAVHFATATMDYRIAQVLEPNKIVKVKLAWLRPLLVSFSLLFLLMIGGDS